MSGLDPDHYERRFRLAAGGLPVRRPWVPAIAAQAASVAEAGEVSVHHLRFTSWPDCRGAAHLYLPGRWAGARVPGVILCCGHGAGGKLCGDYRAMAGRVAALGAAVLVPDNIGQGERAPMGHSDCVGPFACGVSVQGLIVLETMGWLAWLGRHERVDPSRVAAIGNSGGGVLTLFLGAFCRDGLAGLSSSGYPSTFEFIARKRKKHCHCNVLPGIVGELEMWQLYGCFAPKPIFLFQGEDDELFPRDLFEATARRVEEAYRRCGAAGGFRAEVFGGGHSWDARRVDAVGEFLHRTLGFAGDPDRPPEAPPGAGECFEQWPAGALTTDGVAELLTGSPPAGFGSLREVFPPQAGLPADGEAAAPGASPEQICAQFEAFLKKQ